MGSLRLILIFVLALAVALVATLPLKLIAIAAGGQDRFGYTSVYGPVWSGRAYGVRLGEGRVREVRVALRPVALLTGRLSLDLRAEDADLRGRGRAALGLGGSWSAQAVSVSISLGRLGLDGLPGLDPAEQIFIDIDSVAGQGSECRAAQGQVRSNALFTLGRAYGVDGPPLDGRLSCADGRLRLDYSGESSALSLTGEVVFDETGYAWRAEAQTASGEVADAFALAGFAREGEVFVRVGRVDFGEG